MYAYAHTMKDRPEGSSWSMGYRSAALGGREIFYLFLGPEMAFYRYLLREAWSQPARFLTGKELRVLESFDVEKRRMEWMAGRLNAKLLLSKHVGNGYDFLHFEVLSGSSGRPVAALRLRGGSSIPLRRCLSLSHREGASASAVSGEEGVEVGIDVETMERRSRLMLDDYFTRGEAEMMDGLPPGLEPFGIALCWSIKESVLKAMGTGLGVPADTIEIKKMDAGAGMAEVTQAGSGGKKFLSRFYTQPPYIVSLAVAL